MLLQKPGTTTPAMTSSTLQVEGLSEDPALTVSFQWREKGCMEVEAHLRRTTTSGQLQQWGAVEGTASRTSSSSPSSSSSSSTSHSVLVVSSSTSHSALGASSSISHSALGASSSTPSSAPEVELPLPDPSCSILCLQ